MSVADVVFLLYILVYVYNMFYYYRSARRSWEKFDVVHTAPVTRISLGIESHGAFAIGDLNVVNFHLHPRCANWNVHAHFRSAEIRGQDLILGLSASGLAPLRARCRCRWANRRSFATYRHHGSVANSAQHEISPKQSCCFFQGR